MNAFHPSDASGMDDELLYRSALADTTPAEAAAVARWRALAPENERHFDEVTEVLRLAAAADDELAFGPVPTGEDLASASSAQAGSGWRRSRSWRLPVLAAAAIAAVLVALPIAERVLVAARSAETIPGPAFGPDEFVTDAEPATVGLRDGSVVRLAPGSRLRVHGLDGAREVSLVGRGYFAVSPDSERPFTIRGEAGTITVLGTRFDLTADGEDFRLIVIEGRVRLSARGSEFDVGAGQLAGILKGNPVPPIDVPDPASLVGWVGNFIAFQDTPLRVAAREIEQRHGVRIELADGEIGDRTVSAWFAGRNLEEITEVICLVANLRCSRVGSVLRMAPAQAAE